MKTILVIPGHGGNQPGAVAANGIREDRVNLNTAMYLTIFLRENNFNVHLLRCNHEDGMELSDRMSLIMKTKPDFVVSIHHDSSVNKSVSGANCCVQVDYNKKHGKASSKFAEFAEPYLKQATGFEKINRIMRPQKDGRDYYGILRAAALVSVPAVITEFGYMSNPNDLSKFDTFLEQQEEARAIYHAIMKLRGEGCI